MHTPEELVKRALWKKTPMGIACRKRYEQSPAGKEATKRKNATPETKLRKKKWREKHLYITRKRNADQRLAIIGFYGGECLDCGIKDPEVLTLDHVGGGGQGHRNRISKGRIEGNGIYHWVWKFIRKKESPPVKLELTCRNCNWKRHLAKLRKDMEKD